MASPNIDLINEPYVHRSTALALHSRRALCRLGLCLAILWAPIGSVCAGGNGTYLSDLWWNPKESGWGVTVSHQEEFLFLTFFIYGEDGRPYWVTAELTKVSGTTTQRPVYSGPVYETHGPYFGRDFDAGAVTVKQVGTATFSVWNSKAAALTYTINGVAVTKDLLQRQTLVPVDFSGQYHGSVVSTLGGGCLLGPLGPAGQQWMAAARMTITQSADSISLAVEDGGSNRCTYNGRYRQLGQFGEADGTYTCVDGAAGRFLLEYMQSTRTGFTAGLNVWTPSCLNTFYIGGATITPN